MLLLLAWAFTRDSPLCWFTFRKPKAVRVVCDVYDTNLTIVTFDRAKPQKGGEDV